MAAGIPLDPDLEEGPHPPFPRIRPATGGWPGDTRVQGGQGLPARSRQAGQAFLARGMPTILSFFGSVSLFKVCRIQESS